MRIYDRLNARFFGGALRVPLTWGRGSGRARRGGLTFGSYDPVLGLIRIHPVLDRRDVPLYFLESVVYHEMLHHHLGGVPDRAGRTVYHSRAFREAEARYPVAPRGPRLGEGEPAPPAPGQPGAGPRAAQARRAKSRPQRRAGSRSTLIRAALPHLRRLLPYLRRHRRGLAWGLVCLAAHHRLLRGLALGAAPRDRRPRPARSPAAKLFVYAGLLVGLVRRRGGLPLLHADGADRRQPRDRVRAAQRPLPPPDPPRRRATTRRSASATS